MPPKNRSGRPAFGGKLLAVPTPLPDDDEAQPVEESAPAIEELPLTTPTEPPPAPDLAPVLPEPVLGSLHPDEINAARPSHRPSRERAPGTIRLDDRSGHALWEAYVGAKVQDPFLSYRQFASRVVLDGLAVHRRREKRST